MFLKIPATGSNCNLWQCNNCGHKEWRLPNITPNICCLCGGNPWPPNKDKK